MNPDEILRSARGDINADVLTTVGTGGFLSTGYFRDEPLIEKLHEDEQLHHLCQHPKKGVLFTREGGETHRKPGRNYRSGLIVTDKRVVIVIGGGSDGGGDWTRSIGYHELTEATASTGLLNHSLELTGEAGGYRFYTKTKDDVEAVAEYIQAQIDSYRETGESRTTETDPSRAVTGGSTSDNASDPAGESSTGANAAENPSRATSGSEQPPTDSRNGPLPDPTPIGRKMYAYSRGDDTTASSRDVEGAATPQSTEETADSRTERSDTSTEDRRSNSGKTPEQTESGRFRSSDDHGDVGSISDAIYSHTPSETSNRTGTDERSAQVNADSSQTSPTKSTTVSVRDQDGLGIEGASLEIEGIDRTVSDETDETGEQSVTLPAKNDRVDVEISKQGYESVEGRVPFTADSTIDVTLEPVERTNTRTIQLLIESPSAEPPRGDTVRVTAGSVEATEAIHAGGRRAFEVPEGCESITIEVLQDGRPVFEAERETQANSVYELVVPEAEEQSDQSAGPSSTTREAMLAELRRLEEEESRKLTRGLARSKGEYDPEAYAEEFGTWSAAKEKLDTGGSSEAATADTGHAPSDAPAKARLFSAFKELRDSRERPISKGAISLHTPYESDDYVAQFGTWEDAISELRSAVESDSIPDFGQGDPDPDTPSKRELLADFKRVVESQRRTSAPTKGSVRAHGAHDPEAYEARFGTWSNAKAILSALEDDEASDDCPSVASTPDRDDDGSKVASTSNEPTETDPLETPDELRNKSRYTRADLLREIRRITEQVEGRPTTADFTDHAVMSVAVVYNFFDSWSDAVAAAVERSDSAPTAVSNPDSSGPGGSQFNPSQAGGAETDRTDGMEESPPELSTLRHRSDGRLDELVLRVEEVDWVRDDYYTAHLTVSGADLGDVTFEIWTKHDIDAAFESGQVYRFSHARLKIWGDPTEGELELSSTRAMGVRLPGDPPSSPEAGPSSSAAGGSEAEADTEDDAAETEDQEADIVDEIMGDIDI